MQMSYGLMAYMFAGGCAILVLFSMLLGKTGGFSWKTILAITLWLWLILALILALVIGGVLLFGVR